MSDLYFLNYNNYQNRIVKFEKNLSDYYSFCLPPNPATSDLLALTCNFNPDNSITTSHVVNWKNKIFPNYMLVVEDGAIVSRWYVMDKARLRGDQYRFMLRRDLLADNWPSVAAAPLFIEKGPLSSSDPMIFNSEDMTFNQIKTNETLLKDETGCAWIVGYLASVDSDNTPKPYNISFAPSFSIDLRVQNLQSWQYQKYINNKFMGPFKTSTYTSYFAIEYEDKIASNKWDQETQCFTENGIYRTFENTIVGNPSQHTSLNISDKITNNQAIEIANNLIPELSKYYDFHTQEQVNEFLNLNGKTIYSIEDDKLYKINITTTTASTPTVIGAYINASTQPILFNIFNKPFNGKGNNASFQFHYFVTAYALTLTDATQATYTLDIPATRYHLRQAPYDMFCIPFSDELEIKQNGTVKCTASKNIAFNVAMALARKYGNDSAKFLYDIQLLPYCPARYCIQADGSFDITNNDAGVAYVKNESGANVGAVIFVTDDSFTFNILLEEPIEITDTKIQSECDLYRLCSPNYNGVFEFNAAKNGGVSYVNVDATYKPYNPYLHLNPNFGELYGRDFDDSRGLIVGGDFSLPQTTSAWESYQLTTKNYQASFDRQITNMEINNAIQYQKDLASMAANTISAGVSGATAGGLVGGPLGAVIGLAVGGTASAAAGAYDVAQNQLLRQEAIDYTKDQFGYTLGNIKALPTGLSKTSAFTENNKIFPFLEYYTCTEEEKNALRNKIKYNGMTIMRIGTISELLTNIEEAQTSYIKGKLIRLDQPGLEYEEMMELANELNKGVFYGNSAIS